MQSAISQRTAVANPADAGAPPSDAIVRRRVSAELDGEFVVFLIGMRINTLWKIWSWLPVVIAMGRMQAELARDPELGLLLSANFFSGPRNVMTVQYWRGFDHLEAYARGKTNKHLPAWQDFNRTKAAGADVGIWHETFVVKDGAYETLYNNMPRHGLGLAGRIVDSVGRRNEARQRMQGAGVEA